MAKKKQTAPAAAAPSRDPDIYLVPAHSGEGRLTEKMSRFLAFAQPVGTAEEAREFVKDLQNRYHDARHVCWAYVIGEDAEEYQLNDNGEPSGTAGRPIHGQIRSSSLTNVCVAVVRYFGGIKLGTPGLTAAYKESARLALEDAGSKELRRQGELWVEFPYEDTGAVMKLVKAMSLEIFCRQIDNITRLGVKVDKSRLEMVRERLAKVGKVED